MSAYKQSVPTGSIGFDNEAYLKEQTAAILKRVNRFHDKLYLEFGGKILFDYHAARVLPGFDPNVKMRLLQKLKNKIDIILCIHAGAIERKKIRADFGITYDTDALKTIDDFSDWGIEVTAVVITRYENQPPARSFKNKLERNGIRVYTHRFTKGYPSNVDLIVSDEGYGSNEPIETSRPIVVVTGPGPGSGKLATCLSNLYHEYKNGVKAGYAKFETFPIWNLPLSHKVNIAYEAATVDLKDLVQIDHHHLEAYNVKTVNYNRDIEAFPLLKRILGKITGEESIYRSPTDMGVNRASAGITDDTVIQDASHQEIIRRYFRSAVEYAMGLVDRDTVYRAELIMEKVNAKVEDRAVVKPSRDAAISAREEGKGNEGIYCGAAIELRDGTIITGKNSSLMHAASSLILNATKHLAKLPDDMHLLPKSSIDSLTFLKKEVLTGKMISLDLEETLIVLGISAISNPAAQLAVEKLKELRNCEVHLTHIPTPGDEAGLRKLHVNLTCDPEFSTKSLFLRE
ncbi:MAG: hypothetical protein AMS23_04075 [Bacteroides sp. SM1_62]|nr:MAG: hypothetical protein AMS26_12595 [Bacteroides sp. SM23_62]KPL25903.1 MAG: hypothetical protein AMS23_04075 [Bacteroides sp. SM1_62]